MSDVSEFKKRLENLTPEQLQAVAGGDCSLVDLVTYSDQLIKTYEDLIDLTSYVIERVAGN